MQCCVLILIALALRIFVYGLYQIPTGSMETTLLVGDVLVGNKLTLWWKPPNHNDIIVFNDPDYTYSNNSVMRLIEHYVKGPINVTKRVIGVPGDHIVGVIEQQKPVVYRNGKRLEESYVNTYPIILLDDTAHESLDISGTDTEEFRSYDPDRSYDAQPFYAIDENATVRTHKNEPFIRLPYTPVMDSSLSKLDGAVDYWDGSDIFNVTLKVHQYWVMGDNRRNSLDSRLFGPINVTRIRALIWFRLFSIDTSFYWSDVMYAPWSFFNFIRWKQCCTFVSSYHTTIKE